MDQSAIRDLIKFARREAKKAKQSSRYAESEWDEGFESGREAAFLQVIRELERKENEGHVGNGNRRGVSNTLPQR